MSLFILRALRVSVVHLVAACMLTMLTVAAAAQEGGASYAVLVGGLGGTPEHTEVFGRYLSETRRALVDRFGFPEDHVVVLAENALEGQPFVDGVSTAEGIRDHFVRLAGRVTPDDHVYVVLFGHGSFDGTHAQLNIPRRDLDDAGYAELVAGLDAGRLVFINTASASAPFAGALSGPERIVITATRTGTQRNETTFPRYLVEALHSPAADMDKDGNLSVRELFVYAARQTAQAYEAGGHLATEDALLEDTGDGEAVRLEELDGAAEGNLAAVTYLGRRSTALAASQTPVSEAMRRMLRDREALERAIAELKSQKNTLAEDDYYARLETLFVRLARLNDAIEAQQ